jgi:radical SAM protein with 4Fe4S-binding SPASM domain
MDYDQLVKDIGEFYEKRGNCRVYVKMADVGFSPEEIAKFYKDFEDKSDFIAIEHLHGWSMSEEKDFILGLEKESFDGIPLVPKIACPWSLYELGINSNGTVGLCNDDWAHKTVVGDLKQESLLEIWNGENLFEIRRLHLEGRRSENTACGNCYYVNCAPDNIDPFRDEILKKLIDARSA